jgi:hypothetical protein
MRYLKFIQSKRLGGSVRSSFIPWLKGSNEWHYQVLPLACGIPFDLAHISAVRPCLGNRWSQSPDADED